MFRHTNAHQQRSFRASCANSLRPFTNFSSGAYEWYFGSSPKKGYYTFCQKFILFRGDPRYYHFSCDSEILFRFDIKVGQVPVWFNDWESETECPALEVLSFRRSSYIYFGASTVIRSYRPKEVNFRVGQVVKSKFTSYQGVIIGWDETAVAPESWFIHAYPSDKPHWKYQPSYRILVDSSRAITYEPQENLELIQQIKISNSNVWDYFTHFDGSQYLPKPWLKYLYPKD
ncbi:unnamed protein product [Lepeophtheirus salmonis]|uniref:(salmon louse) hypothetical protein n=1 Tax=Lepeophtheirus salmonis TaxID=72036 RepID=A0A7R8CUQ6_LEPSM|nr:unnamed protein product [Lepeophtheirus salmonis]CAF2938811.1 unnamed protein product [Lepeophtheirus salmonis]